MISKELATAVAAIVLQQSAALSTSLGLTGFPFWKAKPEVAVTAVFVDEKTLPSPAQALGPVIWRDGVGVTGVELRLDAAKLQALGPLPRERLAASFLPDAVAQIEMARAREQLLPRVPPNFVALDGLERARAFYEAAAGRTVWSGKDAGAPSPSEAADLARWDELARGGKDAKTSPWPRLRLSSGEDGTLRLEGKAGGNAWLESSIRDSAEAFRSKPGAAVAVRDLGRREQAAALALLAKPQPEAEGFRWQGQVLAAEGQAAGARGDWKRADAAFDAAAEWFTKAGGGPDMKREKGPAASAFLQRQRDAVKAGRLSEALDNLRGFQIEPGADEVLTAELAGLILDAAAAEGPKASERAMAAVAAFGSKPGVMALLRARAARAGEAAAAAGVLGLLGTPGWEALRALLADSRASNESREAAAGGLSRALAQKEDAAASALEKAALDDKSQDLRLSCYRALREAGLLRWELIEGSMKKGGVAQRSEAVADAQRRFEQDPKRAEAVLRQGLADKAARVADDARQSLRERHLR